MENLLQIARAAAGAVAVLDCEMRVRYWSSGAEALLGMKAAEVLGRYCRDVLQAADVFGNPYCHPGCPIGAMVREGISPHPIELFARHGSGERLRVQVTILPVRDPQTGTYWSVYQLHRSVTGAMAMHDPAPKVAPLPEPPEPPPVEAQECPAHTLKCDSLTAREREVLQHLAQGLEPDDISRALNISPVTVRNHIQSVLRKLDVRNRLQAVMVAMKRKLL